jgi:hypothetical protein
MALGAAMGVPSKRGATMAMRRARRTATMALLVAALASADRASAKIDTLAQGAMNLVGSPMDVAMSPYTATSTFVRKYYAKGGQSTLAKVVTTPAIGLVYIPSCAIITFTVAALRFADGLLNVPVGLAVLGSDVDPGTSIYEPVHGEYGAVVDAGPIYFGGYHCEGFFQ